MQTDILFLTLNVFSATGGIEKVCRVVSKAMYEYSTGMQYRCALYSMHDPQEACYDNKYLPEINCSGFGGAKASFVAAAIKKGAQSRVVLVSHVNLLFPAWMIKKLSPNTKIILFAHGIEIWDQLPLRKKMMLKSVDQVVSVSAYTQANIMKHYQLPAAQCRIINNCLDPYVPLLRNVVASEAFYKKYQCQPTDTIIFTLTRISASEHYKGYDVVLRALTKLNNPNIKYLLAGKYDETELLSLQKLISKLGLSGQVIIPGFIPDEDVAALFTMATVYAMPSTKEGFGIVFIEAMHYGVPVVAGNADGSVDALLGGKLGTLVSPKNADELAEALRNIISNPDAYKADVQLMQKSFSYEAYKRKINELLDSVIEEKNAEKCQSMVNKLTKNDE